MVMLISAIIGGFSRVGYFHFPELPLVGFTLIGVVLSIFLGFKTLPVMTAGGKHVNSGVF